MFNQQQTINCDQLHRFRQLCIAPMMKITNRHFRYLIRLISKRTMLYSEMISALSIYKGKRIDLLKFNFIEKPIALQLAGNDPNVFASTAKIAEQLNYDEININIGCPSIRSTAGEFGLCLLKKPHIVADIVSKLNSVVKIPVSIKTRIAVDQFDSLEYLSDFINICQQAGCNIFILHARPGFLNSFSTKQNLKIPKLNYERVFKIKKLFPNLKIIINGGLSGDISNKKILKQTDGLMYGRIIANNPFFLSNIEKTIYNIDAKINQKKIIKNYLDYFNQQSDSQKKIAILPFLKLFTSMDKAKTIRKFISENFYKSNFENKFNSVFNNLTHQT